MGGRSHLFFALGAALLVATPAYAGADDVASINLKQGRLSDALKELAVGRRVGILFAPEVVGSRLSPRVIGRMDVAEALDKLLDGSGLSYRRLSGETFIVFLTPAEEAATALPELLVVGRATQNVDIRRFESDIQLYQVQTSQDIASSRADQLGQFIRDRFTFDAHGATADPNTNRSTFNIHGLSSNETLILVDGARMPSIPTVSATGRFAQADLNGLPMMAVDRVEALTTTSGGIYGPGATGGVVNVVLKRDYRGAEVTSGFGVTEEGDAVRKRIEGRIGFTPDDGRTDIMAVFSHATAEALLQGDRDYSTRIRSARVATNLAGANFGPPTSEAIVVRSSNGANLTLKSSLGGQAVGAPYVFIPMDHGDLRSDGGAVLLAGAMSKAAALSIDNPHDRQSLTPSTTTTSAITSLRHKFGDHVEGFVDLVYLRNDSETFTPVVVTGYVPNTSASNPFNQLVNVSFTAPGFWITGRNRLSTYRLTGGIVARVTESWKVEAAYSYGGLRTWLRQRGVEPTADLASALSGAAGAGGAKPAPNVFGDWDTLVADLQAYKKSTRGDQRLALRFQDASLRLAGPLAQTPAGAATLTVVGEWRQETALPQHTSWDNVYSSGEQVSGSYSQSISSLYGELRAPLVPRQGMPWPLRGLEVQAAARYDDSAASTDDPRLVGRQSWHRGTLATVLGFRTFLLDRLMLRASTATGALPPWPDALLSTSLNIDFQTKDPRRGNTPIDGAGVENLSLESSSRVRPETARTTAFGLVLNPDQRRGPRVSLDYTRIDKEGEIVTSHRGDVQFFLAYESLFPSRVRRAPLTAADVAAGYTGGVITGIDASAPNAGHARLEAIDLKGDQRILIGSDTVVRPYGSVTWTRRFTRAVGPDARNISYLESLSGPLKIRANLGVDLDQGPWTVGLNGQFYGAHGDQTIDMLSFGVVASRIPSQAYLDLNAIYRFGRSGAGPFRNLEVRFGVANLLDRSVPTGFAGLNLIRGYSPFGDPRGRRFDLSVSASF